MENGGISSYLNLHLYIVCICMTYTYYTYWCTVVKRTGHHPLVWLASHVWGVFSSWRHSDDIRDWSQFHLPWYKINVYDAMIHGITVKLIDECHSTVSYSFLLYMTSIIADHTGIRSLVLCFMIHRYLFSSSCGYIVLGSIWHDMSCSDVFLSYQIYTQRSLGVPWLKRLPTLIVWWFSPVPPFPVEGLLGDVNVPPQFDGLNIYIYIHIYIYPSWFAVFLSWTYPIQSHRSLLAKSIVR